ncbi:MAG: hypothetical protein ACFE95_20420 [Candidatus Hodarchaeota archaeon]
MISSTNKKLPKETKTLPGQEWGINDVRNHNKIFRSFIPFIGNFNKIKTIHYIPTDNQKPVIYFLLQDLNDEIHIGYPITLPKLSIEVQNKFYYEIFDYITKFKSKKEIRLYVPVEHENTIDFFIKRGLIIKSELLRHEFEVSTLSNFSISEESIKSRLAKKADLCFIVDLIKSDIQFKRLLSEINDITEYIERSVLGTGRTLLIFQQEKLIAAVMPVLDEEDDIVLEFYAIRSGNEVAWKPVLLSLAKLCVFFGWNKKLVIFMNSYHNRVFHEIVDNLQVLSSVEGFFFGLKNNNFS